MIIGVNKHNLTPKNQTLTKKHTEHKLPKKISLVFEPIFWYFLFFDEYIRFPEEK